MEPPDSKSPPSLSKLVARVRSPEAGIAEVDALLRGLDQRRRPGEDAEERAELLQRILDDPFLRSLTGSDGRRVHAVAAQAMVALGPPYSLELDPEHLAAMRPAGRAASRPRVSHDEAQEPPLEAQEPPPVEVSPRQKVGLVLLIVTGAVESIFLFTLGDQQGLAAGLLVGVLISLGTSFAPALVATSDEGIRNRVLHYICLALVVLPCLPMAMFASVAVLFAGSGSLWKIWLFAPLALVLARLVGAICLYGRPQEPTLQE
jgi:hypothetical protein